VIDNRPEQGLLGWYTTHARDLPWRNTREPWPILVSEVMLSQTQVARVAKPWHDFLASFPSPERCALASPAAVIDAWAGLGFNRRALNLHRSARMIVEHHHGQVPRELPDLLALPGVGPYIARAVRVFAFEMPDAVVDTNVARVLARFHHKPLTRAKAQALADDLVARQNPWAWNQAMIELGATVCRSRSPECRQCVFAASCGWRAAEYADPDPARVGFGASKPQGRFEGSDRQARGRIVDALRAGSAPRPGIASQIDWGNEHERLERIIDGLIGDGLVAEHGGVLSLPAATDRTPSGP